MSSINPGNFSGLYSANASQVIQNANVTANNLTVTNNATIGGNLTVGGNIVGNVQATPGGANTQIQYNASGAFAGSANLVYDDATGTFTATRGDIGGVELIANNVATSGYVDVNGGVYLNGAGTRVQNTTDGIEFFTNSLRRMRVGNSTESGAVTVDAGFTATGNITAAAATITGNITAGNVAGGIATFSGNVQASSMSATNVITVGTGSIPGIINVNDVGSVRFFDNNSSMYVGLRGPGDGSVSYDIYLPNAQGAASTTLINDGSGTLTWGTLPSDYGNANVANYLPTFGGNIGAGNVTVTGTITGGNLVITGTGNIDNIVTDAVQLDTAAAETNAVGKIYWNADTGTVAGGVTAGLAANFGEDSLYQIYANATITKGQVVSFVGVQGDKLAVEAANAAAPGFNALYVVGLAAENYNAGTTGFAIAKGRLTGISTSEAVGNILWFDPATPGGVTATEPSAPNPKVVVAAVTKTGSGGQLEVRITSYPRLGDLQDVQTATANTNDFLRYTSSSLWEAGPLAISYDTTPELGGNLAGAGYAISNVSSVTATGNITGDYILGNGSQLTGLPAGYTDSDVANLLAAFGSNAISTTGNIDAGNLAVSGISTLTGNVFISGNINGNGTFAPTDNTSPPAGALFFGDKSVNDGLAGTNPSNLLSIYHNGLVNLGANFNKQNNSYTTLSAAVANVNYGNRTATGLNRHRTQIWETYLNGTDANLAGTSAVILSPINNFLVYAVGPLPTIPASYGGNITLGAATGTLVRGTVGASAGNVANVLVSVNNGSSFLRNNGGGTETIGNSIAYLSGTPSNVSVNHYGFAQFRRAPLGYFTGNPSVDDATIPPTNFWFLYGDDDRANSRIAGTTFMDHISANGNISANTITANVEVISTGNITATGNLTVGNAIAFSGNIAVGNSAGNITHKMPITIDGVVYYIALYDAP